MLAFFVEKPPVAIVPNVWHKESNTGMPPSISRITSKKESICRVNRISSINQLWVISAIAD